MTIKTRKVNNNDLAFIYSTFLRGVYYGCEFFGKIEKRAFYKNYSPIIERIVALPGASVLVACLPDDESVIVGYVIARGSALHFAYVKQAWRRQGIAALLLNALDTKIETVSHITKVGDAIRLNKQWAFDPFML